MSPLCCIYFKAHTTIKLIQQPEEVVYLHSQSFTERHVPSILIFFWGKKNKILPRLFYGKD